MWNHSTAFGSHQKSGDMDAKSASPTTSANGGGSANTVSSERSEAEVETWMILEYCDKGSLQARPLSHTLFLHSFHPSRAYSIFRKTGNAFKKIQICLLVSNSRSGFAFGAVLPASYSSCALVHDASCVIYHARQG